MLVIWWGLIFVTRNWEWILVLFGYFFLLYSFNSWQLLSNAKSPTAAAITVSICKRKYWRLSKLSNAAACSVDSGICQKLCTSEGKIQFFDFLKIHGYGSCKYFTLDLHKYFMYMEEIVFFLLSYFEAHIFLFWNWGPMQCEPGRLLLWLQGRMKLSRNGSC